MTSRPTGDPVTDAELTVEIEANRVRLEQLRDDLRALAERIRREHPRIWPEAR